MPEPSAAAEREASVYCRYLSGKDATPYVIGKYALGRERLPRDGREGDLLDRALLAVSMRGPWFTRLSDTYAALFRRMGPLRHRLVLMVAVLENTSAFHRPFDTAAPGSRLGTLTALVASGAGWGLRLLVAAICFAPVHAWAALRGGRTRDD